ncbi:MAG: hypothetical protein CMM25_09755 [Rhodospirillaceae bacterium]|nr:hypothetical protein [Rhodospirillaceae bacterium]|tara:strand:- start:1454 stop:2053 length:600 start_codon:yes stop_codon:yes gene_type:complete
MNILGVILAGGDGRRIGQLDKPLVKIGEVRMIDLVMRCLVPQISQLAISVQRRQAWTSEYPFQLLEDPSGESKGPIAGIASGLSWMTNYTDSVDWLVSVSVDCPFIPNNLVSRLTSQDHKIVVAMSQDRVHHTIAAWRPEVLKTCKLQMSRNEFSLKALQQKIGFGTCNWEIEGLDPFFNINCPDDIEAANQFVVAKKE